jgi:hypothetical protein
MATSRRAALYVRVSTSDRGQTVENQLQPLQEAAGLDGRGELPRRGHPEARQAAWAAKPEVRRMSATCIPHQRTPLANITGTITCTSSPFDSLSRS